MSYIQTVRVLLLNNADPLKSDLSGSKPIDKTTLPQIKSLIERKINSLQGIITLAVLLLISSGR